MKSFNVSESRGIEKIGEFPRRPKVLRTEIGKPIWIDNFVFEVVDVVETDKVVLNRPIRVLKNGTWIEEWVNRTFHSKDGYKFVMIQAYIENKGNSSKPFITLNEELLTDNNLSYSRLYYNDIVSEEFKRNPRLSTEDEVKNYKCENENITYIPPRSSREDCILFEIKEDEKPIIFRFRYEKNYVIIVNLKEKSTSPSLFIDQVCRTDGELGVAFQNIFNYVMNINSVWLGIRGKECLASCKKTILYPGEWTACFCKVSLEPGEAAYGEPCVINGKLSYVDDHGIEHIIERSLPTFFE